MGAHDIDEQQIERMVRTFYGRVRVHAVLGPIFAEKLGDDWEPHLLKLMDFWSSVLLKSGRYTGRPVPAHKRLSQVRTEHFAIWLGVFKETLDEIFEPLAAQFILQKAEKIAESLQMAMFFDPSALDPKRA